MKTKTIITLLLLTIAGLLPLSSSANRDELSDSIIITILSEFHDKRFRIENNQSAEEYRYYISKYTLDDVDVLLEKIEKEFPHLIDTLTIFDINVSRLNKVIERRGIEEGSGERGKDFEEGARD